MNLSQRREFLQDVGCGMLAASVGTALAIDLGLAPRAFAGEESKPLKFGELEPLVALLQETPSEKLLPVLAAKQKEGVNLRRLTAAAALANARTFGGEDYFGFHTFMAFAPAFQMAKELPAAEQPLPVWKVLYRNAFYTEKHGGHKNDVLHQVDMPEGKVTPEQIRAAVNKGDAATADRLLVAMAQKSPEDALNSALLGVEDNNDVHMAVMPWRAWTMLDFVGKEYAATMLRQSVRQTSKRCRESNAKDLDKSRQLIPKLLDQHKLHNGAKGRRDADDLWIEKMCETVLTSRHEAAADAVAAALAEGFSPAQVGEAISLAANQLVLRLADGQRAHGASAGVHMSDETNAWRNMTRVSNPRNAAVGLILAAIDIARHYEYSMNRKSPEHQKEAFPLKEQVQAVSKSGSADLLKELDGAVRENNQLRACAIVQAYGEAGHDAKPVFELLRGYAISEDGRLHSEKYYLTTMQEFATTRPAFRWRQLLALARVTASSYGLNVDDKKVGRAPGYAESRQLLGI